MTTEETSTTASVGTPETLKAPVSKKVRTSVKKVEKAQPETVVSTKAEVRAKEKAKERVAVETDAPSAPEEAKTTKQSKTKLVRDSFTMPYEEYQAITTIKKRCLGAGVVAKKSEVLRAAVMSLAGLSDDDMVEVIQGLDAIKTGRPARNTK